MHPIARLALAVSFAALLAAGGSGAAGRGTVATLYVAPSGSDSSSCTQASPCRSFNRAYRVASPGDVVEIAGGTYPHQQINRDGSKTSSADVVFRPAPGASVFVRTIDLGNGLGTPAPSHVTIRDLRAGEMQAFTPAQDVSWINIDAGNFYIRGVQHMLVKGGDWGPCISHDPGCGGNSKIDYPAGEQPNNDITIDGAVFHDYRISRPDDHYECMFLAGGTNITIRNTKFRNCEFYDIFVTRINTTPSGTFAGLRIENNWFDTPWNGQNVKNRIAAISFAPWGTPFDKVLLARNSFASATSVEWNGNSDGSIYTRFRVLGNILGPANGCYPTISFTDNVFLEGACGRTARRRPFGYRAAEGRLRPVAAEAAAVRRAFASAAAGQAAAEITVQLQRGGGAAPAGGWTEETLQALLRDRIYLGGLYGAPGAHPALVTPRTWTQAQRVAG